MRFDRFLVLALVPTLLLAGCSGSDGKPNATAAPSTSAPPPTVSVDKGSIAGTVIDGEISPVAGADVGILQSTPELKTVTDKDGKFTFNDVAPGTYKVVAQKLGYETAPAKSVVVEAGRIAELKFVLTPLPVDGPRQETFNFDGFFSCGMSSPVLTVACRGTIDANDKTSYQSNVSAKAVTIVDTMTWDSTAPGTARIFRDIISITGAGSGGPVEKNGPSPNVVRMDEPTTKKGSKVNHLIWIGWTSVGDQAVVVVYQQKFHILTTSFFGEAAPDDFTGVDK